ncbi:MAG TPA: tetratricopeptide repeat protein [Anaerolineae bacterium]
MSKRIGVSLLLITFVLALGVGGFWVLPHMVNALPGQVRVRLPHQILDLVTTPLPTALPAPAVAAGSTQPGIDIGTLVPSSPTPTVPATFTPAAIVETLPAAGTATSAPPTATPSPAPSATPSAIPLPPAARIEGLVIAPQQLNNCGPTTLSINLNFYSLETTQLDVVNVLKPNYDDRNVSPWELHYYVVSQTPLLATFHSGGDLTLLKRLIATGFPVIIEKGLLPSEREGWMGHYLTLFGYDDGRQEFDTMDTLLGPWDSSGRPVGYEEVSRYWQHFNYTFLVVYRPEQEAAVQAILGPDFLEPAAMWQQAARLAQAEVDAEPGNAFAWFNLGTSLTHLGELTGEVAFYENAAAAFDQARTIGLPPRMLWYQFQPYVAYLAVGRYDDVFTLGNATAAGQAGRYVEETYLYLGHARLAQGDVEGARAAYQQAIDLNPNFREAQQALAELGN